MDSRLPVIAIVGTIRMKKKAILIGIAIALFIAVAGWLVSRIQGRFVVGGDRTELAAREIERALESYNIVHNAYPDPANGLAVLLVRTNNEGPYLGGFAIDAKGQPLDTWGHPFRFLLVDGKPKVLSAGPDGEFGTKDDVFPGRLKCERRYVLHLW